MRQAPATCLCVLLLASCGQSEPALEQSDTLKIKSGMAGAEAELKATSSAASAASAVQRALDKAAKHESLNALIHLASSDALARAKTLDQQSKDLGPLHGELLVVKDNIHVAGMPNTAGTPALKEFTPSDDNPVVDRLKKAGAIVLGKANMHELAFGITSDNAAFGSVKNPSDQSKFAGGSSGGTAAAIAAGIVDAGLGTDTGGSTRIPAALTGIAGFRPTTDRYPSGAVTPISQTRDTVGPMGRTVSDLIRLDSAITGSGTNNDLKAADLSSLRLGVDREYYFSQLDPATERCMDQSLAALTQAGVSIVPAEVPQLSELLQKSGFPIVFYEVARELPEYLATYQVGVSMAQFQAQIASVDVQGAIASAMAPETAVPVTVYEEAQKAKTKLAQVFADYFAENKLDAMIFPTTKLPARDIEGSLNAVELNGQQVPTFPTYIHNTDPASLADLPAVTIPAGRTPTGLPIGIEVDGPAGSDRRLLGIALAIEELLNSGEK